MNPTKAIVLAKITDSSPASKKLTKRFLNGLAERFQVCALDYSENMAASADNLTIIELNEFEFVSVKLPASQPKAVFSLLQTLTECLGEPSYFLIDQAPVSA